jgi:hypothetical protein
MVHKYNNIEEVRTCFAARKPLSVISLTDLTYGCIIHQNKFVKLFCNGQQQCIGGCWYHNWSISDEVLHKRCTEINIKHYCLLLPRLTCNGLPTAVNDPMFTLIESEWMDIQEDQMLSLPKEQISQYV